MRRPWSGTPRRRRSPRRRSGRTARARPCSSGRCDSPPTPTRSRWPSCTRAWPASTRCLTAGRRPRPSCAPRWPCGRSRATPLRIGEDLRLMSTALWRLCRGDEVMQAAQDAVRALESGPECVERAQAYASLGACALSRGQIAEGLDYCERGRASAERLGRLEVQSYALNAIGLGLVYRRPRRNRRHRGSAAPRARRRPAGTRGPGLLEPGGGRRHRAAVRSRRSLLRRGHGLQRRARARRVRPVHGWLASQRPAGDRPLGRGGRASATRCSAAGGSRR